jgi:hypothetical protein
MIPGDSVTRTVVAKISGTSPMFLPGLLVVKVVEGVAAYPVEPKLIETAERGEVGGSRTESVTLVAEGGGAGEEMPVSVEWYNLGTGKIETASVEGFAIAVDGPPVSSSEPRDWKMIVLAGLAALVAAFVVGWLLRRIAPGLSRLWSERTAAWLASEGHAYAKLRRVVAKRDHAALRPALDLWAGRAAGPDPREVPQLQAALTALGKARYGPAAPSSEMDAWGEISGAITTLRNTRRVRFRLASPLPSLNT